MKFRRDQPREKVLTSQAHGLEEAGCFAVVLDVCLLKARRRVTDLLRIPTIGYWIRAYVERTGIVYQDMLGLKSGFKPKFLKVYANAFEVIRTSLTPMTVMLKLSVFLLRTKATGS
jgi:3-methyl-2-oxobutanoate hydroxymethyltransferase